MGKTPEAVYGVTPRHADGFDEKKICEAMTVRVRRRVRGDCTIPSVRRWRSCLTWPVGRPPSERNGTHAPCLGPLRRGLRPNEFHVERLHVVGVT